MKVNRTKRARPRQHFRRLRNGKVITVNRGVAPKRVRRKWVSDEIDYEINPMVDDWRSKIKLVDPKDLELAEPEWEKDKYKIDDIKSSGPIRKPVRVFNKYDSDQKYQVIDGHHRSIAARDRGDDLIPVIVRDNKHATKDYRERKNLPPFDKVLAVRKRFVPDEPLSSYRRFGTSNISGMKKLGKGRDRVVYDLGDGKALKRAVHPRGLRQNQYEEDFLSGFFPEDTHPKVFEAGKDYLVVEKVDKPDKRVSDFLRPLRNFTQKDFNDKTTELQDAMTDAGLADYMNYDLLWRDFVAKRNWGLRGDKPVIIDGGSLGGAQLGLPIHEYEADEWSEVLEDKSKYRRQQR